MQDIYVNERPVHLDPTMSLGRGGEAEVFNLGNGNVIKVYKFPDHPDYANDPDQQRGAEIRIQTHQKKLADFPTNLPSNVIAPIELAKNSKGLIVGYIMPLVSGGEVLMRYSKPNFAQNLDPVKTTAAIWNLHQTIKNVHKPNVVIGDNNDLNVLVIDDQVYLVDADSWQYGSYLTYAFTTTFVDPLLCDPKMKTLELVKPHNELSDWYAFTLMAMQSLLWIGPYGGIHKPKTGKRLNKDMRTLQRVTVFDSNVNYPRHAQIPETLPDSWLHHFVNVFENDWRGEFPESLFRDIRWTTCSSCGETHARGICPHCKPGAAAAITQKETIKGEVKITRFFRSSGSILFAAMQNGKLRILHHENGKFKREDGQVVAEGSINPQTRYRIRGENTIFGSNGMIAEIDIDGSSNTPINVDQYQSVLPVFDANSENTFWAYAGNLYKHGEYGPISIGRTLAKQTLFWVGPEFGFGLYRAGEYSVAFTFDAERKGINDSIQIPPITGKLLDSTAVFSSSYCWFFTTTKQGPQTMNRCILIDNKGTVLAQAETEEGDGSWLGEIRGKCGTGNMLFSVTDDGLQRIESDPYGELHVVREYPDTRQFLNSSMHIFAGPDGIYATNKREALKIKML